MGKGAPSVPTPEASPYTAQLARQSNKLFKQAFPLWQSLTGQYQDILNGGDPSSLPGYSQAYSQGRAGLEGQYNQARQQTIESSPMGAALQGNLADLSAQRASSVGSLPAQLSSQFINQANQNAMNMALGGTQQATGALGTAGNQYGQLQNAALSAQMMQDQMGMQGMGALGSGIGSLGMLAALGGCCFIFIEANGGVLHPIVRRYRDEHMTARNRRGYYRLAERLVPLMRKHKLIYHAVRFFMTEPMVCYGKYFYGLSRAGKIFKPVAKFWLKLYDRLGSGGEYVRQNGEVI